MAANPPKRQKTLISSLPEAIQNFILLPVTLPSPIPSVPAATHIIYLRKHEEPPIPPVMTSDPSRTLFLVNIPVTSTKETLRGLMASFGVRPDDIRIHGQSDFQEDNFPLTWDRKLCPSRGTAHVSFPTPKDADKVLKTISKERRKQDGAIREWGIGVDYPFTSLGFSRIPIKL